MLIIFSIELYYVVQLKQFLDIFPDNDRQEVPGEYFQNKLKRTKIMHWVLQITILMNFGMLSFREFYVENVTPINEIVKRKEEIGLVFNVSYIFICFMSWIPLFIIQWICLIKFYKLNKRTAENKLS
jgi:hypothetical protein